VGCHFRPFLVLRARPRGCGVVESHCPHHVARARFVVTRGFRGAERLLHFFCAVAAIRTHKNSFSTRIPPAPALALAAPDTVIPKLPRCEYMPDQTCAALLSGAPLAHVYAPARCHCRRTSEDPPDGGDGDGGSGGGCGGFSPLSAAHLKPMVLVRSYPPSIRSYCAWHSIGLTFVVFAVGLYTLLHGQISVAQLGLGFGPGSRWGRAEVGTAALEERRRHVRILKSSLVHCHTLPTIISTPPADVHPCPSNASTAGTAAAGEPFA
jgi:hypothetical protein